MKVSIVVVSRHRPAELARCLTGIAQLDHPAVEVIVVADPGGVTAARATGVGPLKLLEFDAPNISAARNLGVGLAAGEVVAFIDDDAVPEPTWLSRLAKPFANPDVAAAGGFVRGRNGLSFQWKARVVNRMGEASALSVDETATSLLAPAADLAIKVEGTNMAFRRSVLAEMGGFDPALRFYLDETELSLRLASKRHLTAIVPLAEVHHGYAASARRSANRAPLSLHEIGASTAVVLRRHAPVAAHADALARLAHDQRRRAVRLMVAGLIEPRDVGRLMASLNAGIADGQQRALTGQAPIPEGSEPFLPLAQTGPRRGRALVGWVWQTRHLRASALAARDAGLRVTLFRFSPTALFHRVKFHPEGYWVQSGGLFGRSDRTGPLVRLVSLRRRVIAECARLASVRPIEEVES